MAFKNYGSTFSNITVTVKTETIKKWVAARIESTIPWLAHKKKLLDEKMKDPSLSQETIKNLLSGRGHGGYSTSNSPGRGGPESHQQAELIALFQRIGELESDLRSLKNVQAGLVACSNNELTVSLGLLASLEPATEGKVSDDEDVD